MRSFEEEHDSKDENGKEFRRLTGFEDSREDERTDLPASAL
jgi:hypothetical protein